MNATYEIMKYENYGHNFSSESLSIAKVKKQILYVLCLLQICGAAYAEITCMDKFIYSLFLS